MLLQVLPLQTCDLEESLGTISLILEVWACRRKFPVIHRTLNGDGSWVKTRMPGESPGGGSNLSS